MNFSILTRKLVKTRFFGWIFAACRPDVPGEALWTAGLQWHCPRPPGIRASVLFVVRRSVSAFPSSNLTFTLTLFLTLYIHIFSLLSFQLPNAPNLPLSIAYQHTHILTHILPLTLLHLLFFFFLSLSPSIYRTLSFSFTLYVHQHHSSLL